MYVNRKSLPLIDIIFLFGLQALAKYSDNHIKISLSTNNDLVQYYAGCVGVLIDWGPVTPFAPALLQVMALAVILSNGTNALLQPMLDYYPLGPRDIFQWNLDQRKHFQFQNFHENDICQMSAILSDGTKALLQPMLDYYPLGPRDIFQWNFDQRKLSISKFTWKWHLSNVGHFVQASCVQITMPSGYLVMTS